MMAHLSSHIVTPAFFVRTGFELCKGVANDPIFNVIVLNKTMCQSSACLLLTPAERGGFSFVSAAVRFLLTFMVRV